MRKRFCFILAAFFFSHLASGEDFTIQTFAGGGVPQNIQGTSAVLYGPAGIVTDANGNAFFTLSGQNIVLKLDSNGILTLVAGNGTPGFSGDGGLAIDAQLNSPWGIALDGTGSLYIADTGNARIRKVQNGVISTIAGGGTQTADNIPAVDALLPTSQYVVADAAGNVYVEDSIQSSPLATYPICCRIRKITNGIITTIAGNGTPGFSGDGGPAISAQLAGPGAMAIDAAGTLYFSDSYTVPGSYPPVCYCNLRKIQNGVINTLVPTVTPNAIAVDSAGNLFIANGPVQEISNGVTTTFAGVQYPVARGGIGDNGPATNAYLGIVSALGVDHAGNVLIGSSNLSPQLPVIGDLIRKVSNGVITTIAGSAIGAQPSIGDNGPPDGAQLLFADNYINFVASGSVAMDTAGNVYIAELNRVRKISQGVVTTVAGTGIAGFSGDGGPATEAQLRNPGGIGVDAAGNLYIADQGNVRARKVSHGIITTIAGNGTGGHSGDGGPATSAELGFGSIAVSPSGDVYVSDTYYAQVVRKISNGTIVTVAGGGTNSGDSGPATGAMLSHPEGLALDTEGNLYIADTFSRRILEVSNGTIAVVAGSLGAPGVSNGDGGPATSAKLNSPTAVAVDALGRIYIGEHARVRRVSNGIIDTVAGNGTYTYGGDGGAAVSASVSPVGLAIGPDGQVYEADILPSRVRALTPIPVPGVSFDASPAPIPLAAGSTVGATTLSWSASGYSSLQIFANGTLFSDVGASGSAITGSWVSDGMNFSLVDPATNAPLSTITVHTMASSNQVTFTASPNPILLAAGATVGQTMLSWNAPGYSNLQIWVAGVLFDAGLPASGSVETGNWVSDGLPFSLIDSVSGKPIATLTLRTTLSGVPQTALTNGR